MRVDAVSKRGGDTVQILNYIKELEKKGIEAVLSTDLSIDITDFDIIHLVNIDRPLETYHFFQKAKRLRKKIVLSPIHHSYSQIAIYENTERTGFLKLLNYIAKDYWGREKIKNIFRGLYNRDLFRLAFNQLFRDLYKMQKEIIEKSDGIALIAKGEKNLIESEFDTSIMTYEVIPNGVKFNSKNTSENISSIKNVYDVLVVGRIEARKNQLNIIKALKDTDLKVGFVGSENKYHKNYVEIFKKELTLCENMEYLGEVPHEEMGRLYKSSKIHLSASWFEVSPLVDLEALYYGCKIVTSKNSFSEEYLQSRALYTSPGNQIEIRETILKALNDNSNVSHRDFINQNFNWESSINKLIDLYNNI